MIDPTLKVIEKAAGIAGVIAIAGYLSVRAHFNFLGVSMLTELSLERYLSETYLFLVLCLPRLLLVCGVASVGFFIWKLLGRVWRFRPIIASPFIWPSLALIFIVWVLWMLISAETMVDVVVGPLTPDKWKNDDKKWLVEIALMAIVIASFAVWNGPVQERFQPVGDQAMVLLSRINCICLIAIVLLLPTRVGTELHPKSYPLALVHLSEPKSVACGLILYQSKENLVLWEAESKVGRIRSIKTKSVIEIISGEVQDIVKLAKESATSDKKFPDCKLLIGQS